MVYPLIILGSSFILLIYQSGHLRPSTTAGKNINIYTYCTYIAKLPPLPYNVILQQFSSVIDVDPSPWFQTFSDISIVSTSLGPLPNLVWFLSPWSPVPCLDSIALGPSSLSRLGSIVLGPTFASCPIVAPDNISWVSGHREYIDSSSNWHANIQHNTFLYFHNDFVRQNIPET